MRVSTDAPHQVLAPIAPGLLAPIPIASHQVFNESHAIPISAGRGAIALDGEREVLMDGQRTLSVRLNPLGPVVVDYETTLTLAARAGTG